MFFENPGLFFLLIVPLLLLVHYIWMEVRGRRPHMRVSSLHPWAAGGRSVMEWLRHLPFILRMAALCLIIVALARPRSSTETERVDTEGIDIVLAMDVSTRMLARDFEPDRTQCPLTTDRATLINLMKDVQTDLIADGTAIGRGLATAVSRLSGSEAKSRVVILLTDGMNNTGEITPLNAAELAKMYGIRVYTIGVGKHGEAPYPVMTPWGVELRNMAVEIDEDLLGQIAESTGGRYFRATDNTKLAEIYSEINQMEKARTTVDSFPVYKELFGKFAIWALLCLLLELALRLSIRRLP